MKNVLTIFLMLLIVSCASVPLESGSDIWQYDDDKFVSFKEKIELSWEYSDPSINYFEIDREKREIIDDIDKIARFVKERNEKKIIEIVNEYRKEIKWDNAIIKYPAKDEREFIDKEYPLPTFENIYFYRLFAVEQPDPTKPGIKSEPVEISVIVLRK